MQEVLTKKIDRVIDEVRNLEDGFENLADLSFVAAHQQRVLEGFLAVFADFIQIFV